MSLGVLGSSAERVEVTRDLSASGFHRALPLQPIVRAHLGLVDGHLAELQVLIVSRRIGGADAAVLPPGEEEEVRVLACEEGKGVEDDRYGIGTRGVHRKCAVGAYPGVFGTTLVVLKGPCRELLSRHGKSTEVLRPRSRMPKNAPEILLPDLCPVLEDDRAL